MIARARYGVGLGYTTVIPGTDRSFVGFQLPHWSEVKALALKSALVFPRAGPSAVILPSPTGAPFSSKGMLIGLHPGCRFPLPVVS